MERAGIPPGAGPPALNRAVLGALVAGLCVAALVAIVAILSQGELDETGARAIATAVVLMGFSLTGLGPATLYQRRPSLRWLALLGMGLAAAGFVATTLEIWDSFGDPEDDGSLRTAFCLIVASFAAGHISVLLAPRVTGGGGATLWVRGGAVIGAAVVAVMLIFNISDDRETVDAQIIGVVAVLYVLATLLIPLVRRLETPDPA